jgi:hypothetical protein
MIIIQLIGGLGNQMFQYAAGRRLAHHHNTDLFLDATGFAYNPLRKYELDVFRINATFAPLNLLKQVPISRKDAIRLSIRKLYARNTEFRYVKENGLDFHEEILSLPDNSYLAGYWQSENYFGEIADIIRKEFSFVNPPSLINQELMEKMMGCNSVSMHIRRGDYVSDPIIMEIHGVLGTEYYKKALNVIEEHVKDPQIFVFSDEIPWAKDYIKTHLPLHFIDFNRAEKNYEDLRLMSHCKHHIIANSSFSWWGAWLSNKKNNVVIAPIKWFADKEMNTRQTIVPDTWITI